MDRAASWEQHENLCFLKQGAKDKSMGGLAIARKATIKRKV